MELNKLIKWLKPCRIQNDNLIRLGTQGDGGYILSEKSINMSDALISLGIKDDWNFESEFLNINKNVSLIAVDLVTDSMFFLKCAISFFIRGKLNKSAIYFIKIFEYFLFFRLNSRAKYIKNGVSGVKSGFISLSDVISKIEPSRNMIFLKIDIEGDEYSLIKDFIKNRNRLHTICIEFHNVVSENSVFLNCIEALSEFYSVVHIHMNNNSLFNSEINLSDVIEVTLVNNNYYDLIAYSEPFIGPTVLDYPCNPLKKEITFKF